jgi:hypothetical protein
MLNDFALNRPYLKKIGHRNLLNYQTQVPHRQPKFMAQSHCYQINLPNPKELSFSLSFSQHLLHEKTQKLVRHEKQLLFV